MFDLWKKYDLMEAAVVYCEEIHHAMWTAYHEDTVVVQDMLAVDIIYAFVDPRIRAKYTKVKG